MLLLDEVLAVGDAEFQEKCFATFQQLIAHRKTIVLVTHDLSAVSKFADRSLVLNTGRVLKIGASDDVIETYRQTLHLPEQLGQAAIAS